MSTEQEILDALWLAAKKPSRNAATLTHNLGVTFPFLETQWDDKARQIIGALVAVNANRMHTTIWAALFQQLRETTVPTIKVYILKQFASVCWTVPVSQGTNAFRAFALEIRPLLSEMQIVTNNAFQKHFSTIIGFLSSFAEESLSLELSNTLYANLTQWKRVDATRAVSNVLATLVLRIPHCPTPETLLARAKPELDVLSYAILLETFIAVDNNGSRNLIGERVASYCREVDDVLRIILKSFSENKKAVPPCVSAYRRLKNANVDWDSAHNADFSNAILEALASENASKLLKCPFLQFLQSTSYNWWGKNNTIWKLTESSDPFVRADAVLALSSKTHFLDTSEKRLTIAELMKKLHHFIEENCSYTITAILKYLQALICNPEIPVPTQQMYLSTLLHTCSRFGKDLRDDTTAQVGLLNLFAAASVVPEAVQRYALKLFFESTDRNVAANAFQTLLVTSISSGWDEQALIFSDSGAAFSFLDGLTPTEHEEHNPASTPLATSLLRGELLMELIHHRFLRLPIDSLNDAFNAMVASDAIKNLCKATEFQRGSHFTSRQSLLTLASQVLLSQEAISSDVYICIIEAATACISLKDTESCTNANLFVPLVQHAWSALVDCAASMYPEFRPVAELPTYRFFRGDATPLHLHELITVCKDVALSNDVALYSSAFFKIVESNMCLLTKCVDALRFSPLFVHELTHALDGMFRCCDALFHCIPKLTLRLLRVIFDVVMSYRAANESDSYFAGGLTSYFSKYCSSVVNRAITLDFLSYCPDLCDFLLFSLQQDSNETRSAFAELLSNNWNVIADLVNYCEMSCTNCGTYEQGKAVYSVLRLVRSLCWGPYASQVKEAVLQEKVDKIASSSHTWKWFPEKAECCQMIFELQSFFSASSPEAAGFVVQSVGGESKTTVSFFAFFERAVDLYNSSNAKKQQSIQQQLLGQHTGESLTVLAALDSIFIPSAVEYVLTVPVERTVLDVLLLILSECESRYLPSLELFVSDAVLSGDNHDLIESLVSNYRWGWTSGTKTKRMTSSSAWRCQEPQIYRFVHQLTPQSVNTTSFQKDQTLFPTHSDDSFFSAQHQLHPGVSAVDLLQFSVTNSFFVGCSPEEILLSNSPSALKVLRQYFVSQDNYADLSGPQVVLLFAEYISSTGADNLFSWKLPEWFRLLRSWVSVTLTTSLESEQWGWLQLGCWILFYRIYNHLFTMARDDHPEYPKENGAQFFEELRKVYLQLSNCFLCCNARGVDDVAKFSVRYALRNASFFELCEIHGEIFWCIIRTCVEAFWAAISSEQWAPLHDAEVVTLLCRTHVRIGWPLHIQRKIHTFLSTQLHVYGSTHPDCDADAQRHALWVISGFGTRFFSLAAPNGVATNRATLGDIDHSDNERKGLLPTLPAQHAEELIINEFQEYLVFRSAVSHDLFKIAKHCLQEPARASTSTVFDALEVLREVSHLTASSTVSLPREKGIDEVEQTYLVVKSFLAALSPLSPGAPSEPITHCLLYLGGQFLRPRQASDFSDEYALSLTTTILSNSLVSWLHRSASLGPPPAQIPIILAIHLPYLTRLDLPLYAAALRCVQRVASCGASAGVEAVLKVVLPRLAEDVTDIQWNSQVVASWYKVLLAFLGSSTCCAYDGKEQLSRRLWEGVWRGAGSPDVCRNQDMQEWAQRALRQLIRDLVPKSPQWELSRLIALSSSIQRKPSATAPNATAEQENGGMSVPLQMATDLERSWWRSLMAETQAAFAVHAAKSLDADNSRSLLFEFEKAVESLSDSGKNRVVCVDEIEMCCLLRERVRSALLPSTEDALAAFNYFSFSSLERRRSVLRGLCGMTFSSTVPFSASDAAVASWTGVYFDILYERATCVDEGLWVACAIAAVGSSGGQREWLIPALQSLIAASSTQWKRTFLRRAAEVAKRNDTQGCVRDFFANASDKLVTSHARTAVWKGELLEEVTFVFTA
jgi:hypothetical protein